MHSLLPCDSYLNVFNMKDTLMYKCGYILSCLVIEVFLILNKQKSSLISKKWLNHHFHFVYLKVI